MSREKQSREAERLAQRFLKNEGCRDIKYEPKGVCTFPDFSIKGPIAVEVRLIANEFLEKTSIQQSFDKILEKVNSKIRDRDKNKSYYVCLNYQGKKKKIEDVHKKLIRVYLEKVSKEGGADDDNFQTPEFQISLLPASFCPDKVFIRGSLSFGDKGELVSEAVIHEVVSCMEEKAAKVGDITTKNYKEYWLILVANREFAIKLSVLSKSEKEFVYKALNSARPKEWDRVIIITESHADATMAVKIVDIPSEEALPVK